MTHLDICNISYGTKKVGNQTTNLTPNHKKSGIDPTLVHVGGVRHTYKVMLVQTLVVSGLTLGGPGTKNHLDVGLAERRR
jgi:hypothetical protein